MPIKLNPCRVCGGKAIIETWSSDGMMYMAKCSNPDCKSWEYSSGHSLPDVATLWNEHNPQEVKPNGCFSD